jgi:hypothetical protein
MKQIIKKQIKTLTVAAVAALSFTSAAHAAINMTFVYDEVAGVTTVNYGGSFNFGVIENRASDSKASFNKDMFAVVEGAYSASVHPSNQWALIPWEPLGAVPVIARTGDFFGIDWQWLYLPLNYLSGDHMEGSFTLDASFDDLNFPAASGAIITHGGDVNWTTVPEPSHYCGILGLIILGAVGCRRRRS